MKVNATVVIRPSQLVVFNQTSDTLKKNSEVLLSPLALVKNGG